MSAQIQSLNRPRVLIIVGLALTVALILTFTRSPRPPRIATTRPVSTGDFLQLPEAAIQSLLLSPSAVPPMEGIEAAERHNLYQMRRYQQRMLRRVDSATATPTGTLALSPLEEIWERQR